MTYIAYLNQYSKYILAFFLIASLLLMGGFVFAAEPEVAGAEIYVNPTPTPTPSLSVTPTPTVSESVTPIPTVLVSPKPEVSLGGGFMDWLLKSGGLWWLIGVAVLIIIVSIYLSRRKKDQSPSVSGPGPGV